MSPGAWVPFLNTTQRWRIVLSASSVITCHSQAPVAFTVFYVSPLNVSAACILLCCVALEVGQLQATASCDRKYVFLHSFCRLFVHKKI